MHHCRPRWHGTQGGEVGGDVQPPAEAAKTGWFGIPDPGLNKTPHESSRIRAKKTASMSFVAFGMTPVYVSNTLKA